MTRHLLFLILLIISTDIIYPQGIVGSGLNPVAGEVKFYNYAFTDGVPDGALEFSFWDYSWVIDSSAISYKYVVPNTTPFHTFDNTSVALTTDDSTYTYYNTNGDECKIAGYGSDAFILKYLIDQKLFLYSFSLGSDFEDEFSGSYVFSGVDVSRRGTVSSLVDAEGTLLLPGFMSYSVLRVMYEENVTDSFFIAGAPILILQTNSVNYIWVDYTNDEIVLQIKLTTVFDGAGSNSFKTVLYKNEFAVGISDSQNPDNAINVFCDNQNILHITGATNLITTGIRIFDMKGSLAGFYATADIFNNTISLAQLPPGLYAVAIYFNDSFITRKIMIR